MSKTRVLTGITTTGTPHLGILLAPYGRLLRRPVKRM